MIGDQVLWKVESSNKIMDSIVTVSKELQQIPTNLVGNQLEDVWWLNKDILHSVTPIYQHFLYQSYLMHSISSLSQKQGNVLLPWSSGEKGRTPFQFLFSSRNWNSTHSAYLFLFGLCSSCSPNILSGE